MPAEGDQNEEGGDEGTSREDWVAHGACAEEEYRGLGMLPILSISLGTLGEREYNESFGLRKRKTMARALDYISVIHRLIKPASRALQFPGRLLSTHPQITVSFRPVPPQRNQGYVDTMYFCIQVELLHLARPQHVVHAREDIKVGSLAVLVEFWVRCGSFEFELSDITPRVRMGLATWETIWSTSHALNLQKSWILRLGFRRTRGRRNLRDTSVGLTASAPEQGKWITRARRTEGAIW